MVALFLASCATTPKDDPLKYTKKLAAEGHLSLYRNGAFKVPNTKITLIPAGPSAIELTRELMGIRARESFVTAVENAADSVYIVSEGTKTSFSLAKGVQEGGNRVSDEIKGRSREGSTLLIYRSSEYGKGIIGNSWELSKETFRNREKTGDRIIEGSQRAGRGIEESGRRKGDKIISGSRDAARDISFGGSSRAGSALSYGKESFIVGYAAVPSRIWKRAVDLGDNLEQLNIAHIAKEEDRWRTDLSRKSVDLFSDAANNYAPDIKGSFSMAGKEITENYRTTGLGLSAVKSIHYVLKGLLWDATVKPAAKMTTASLGYIGVNMVAYPTMVILREGAATTNLALEVTWDAAKTGYDIVAPSTIAAVAGVYSVLDFSGSHIVAGTTAATGPVLGYGEKGLRRVAAVTVEGAGYAAGKTVQYIGVPLASAGIAVGGGTIGATVVGAGAVSGGAVRVAGETGAIAAKGFGNVIAGTTAVGGTSVSAAGGTAYGVYELSKAVAVPAGYELGGGIVLSYGTLSHVGAHSILAVSDASYMVLSLEGPRWVLYAVKGKKGSGEDIPAGAVVDLKKMQEGGEEIVYLPVSDGEMKAVVGSVYDNLPEIKTE